MARGRVFAALLLAAWGATGQGDEPAASGRFGTRFTEPSPHARVDHVVRRLTHRLDWQEIQGWLARHGGRLEGQAVDLEEESFELYVPRRPPAGGRGYRLLVWIHAINDAAPRNDWLPVLDELGVIYVGANNSGNGHSPVDRRIPLALHAAWNVQRRYHVDPQRVWVAGMSGGARTASVAAVAFADVFSGGLFAAGADPIGGRRLPLPPPPVWRQLRERSRLVTYTGRKDAVNVLQVRQTHSSYDRYCVRFHAALWDRGVEHANLDRRWLRRGLQRLLEGPPRERRADRDACRERLAEQARAAAADLGAAPADQRAERAAVLDREYGPLAEPFLFPARGAR